MIVRSVSVQQVALSCLLFFSVFQSLSLLFNDLTMLGMLQAFLCGWSAKLLAFPKPAKAAINDKEIIGFIVSTWLLLVAICTSQAATEATTIELWLYTLILCSQVLLIDSPAIKVSVSLMLPGLVASSLIHDSHIAALQSALSIILFLVLTFLVSRHIKHLTQRIKEATTTDPLTGCKNLETFKHELNKGIELLKRYNTPVSAISINMIHVCKKRADLEIFIREVAQICQSRLRQTDILCRLDDKHFVILLPSTEGTNADSVKDDLLLACKAFKFSCLETQKKSEKRKPEFSMETLQFNDSIDREEWLLQISS